MIGKVSSRFATILAPLACSLALVPLPVPAFTQEGSQQQQPPPPPASQPTYTPQDFPDDSREPDARSDTRKNPPPDAEVAPRRELPPDAHPADGRRQRGVPLETYAVAPGTKFLVRLDGDLGSKRTEQNQTFRVRTLEPLEAGSGIYLPSGAEIIGHVSKVEPAGVAGRAKLWLTFDELHTRFGNLPIVAEVVSVPGDHTVKVLKEGLIEGEHSTQQDAAMAAAAGAAMGAVEGVKHKDKKAAAEGAAMGAITAYLMEAGRGHELNLPKNAKLELELERALYLVKE
jgi:hypothetical protein